MKKQKELQEQFKVWGQKGYLELVQAEFAVLPTCALAIGQNPTAAHHDGT